jgi:hypothetical protein
MFTFGKLRALTVYRSVGIIISFMVFPLLNNLLVRPSNRASNLSLNIELYCRNYKSGHSEDIYIIVQSHSWLSFIYKCSVLYTACYGIYLLQLLVGNLKIIIRI